ncbi:MAG: enolase C-terminal domain-like protein [Phycisphaerae bacterium]
MTNVHISQLTIYQLAMPFRRQFRHAAAQRSVGDNIIVQLELGNGQVGFGETLAREYVTGETPASVVDSIQRIFLPILMQFNPDGFGEVIELLERLPLVDNGKPLYAARCAVELALLDVYGKQFNRNPEILTGWIDQPFWEPPGAAASVTYSGVIGTMKPKKAALVARLMRLWKLSDFKIKVGDPAEFDRLGEVAKALARPIKAGQVRLRVDANGAWKPEDLKEKVDRLEDLGILYLEQPTLPRFDDGWLPIQHHSGVNLIADESLVSLADAERLTRQYTVGIFNIRLAKNGGLLPSLKLAAFAFSRGIEVQLGCMVGETGILTAAGQWFANLVPEIIFAEGGYGKWLLKDDLLSKPVKFRYAGKIPTPKGPGLGIQVDLAKIRKYITSEPLSINI